MYVRGEAYLAAGQGRAAAAEFQKIIDHSGIVWNCWTGALAHLGVARANALQARTSQGADADAARSRALAAYKEFLTLWKDADPDIPILKEAKAEYAKILVTGGTVGNASTGRKCVDMIPIAASTVDAGDAGHGNADRTIFLSAQGKVEKHPGD